MLDAVNAARERKTSVVTQLVASGAANARDIALAASNEFGVPLFDLDAVNLDLEAVRLVSDKLLARHRVLAFVPPWEAAVSGGSRSDQSARD